MGVCVCQVAVISVLYLHIVNAGYLGFNDSLNHILEAVICLLFMFFVIHIT